MVRRTRFRRFVRRNVYCRSDEEVLFRAFALTVLEKQIVANRIGSSPRGDKPYGRDVLCNVKFCCTLWCPLVRLVVGSPQYPDRIIFGTLFYMQFTFIGTSRLVL